MVVCLQQDRCGKKSGQTADMLFYHTKICLVWQNYVCRDKTFVMTNIFFSQQKFFCNKHIFVTTNTCLLRQNIFCCDKSMCVMTNTCLCNKHVFVATKMIHVAAPANNIPEAGTGNEKQKRLKVEWYLTCNQTAAMKTWPTFQQWHMLSIHIIPPSLISC